MSYAQFERSIKQLCYAFEQQLMTCIKVYGSTNFSVQAIRAAAEGLSEAGEDLKRALVESDWPPWLTPLTESADKLARGQANPDLLLHNIITYQHLVKPIEVVSTDAYDFDKLFKRLRDEGRLKELFADMIKAVAQMIDSGEIENIYVLQALNKLLALLKANRDGSYLAMARTFDYAIFVKTLVVEVAKKVPGVAEFATAFEKAVNASGEEMHKLENGLRDQSIALILDEKARTKLDAIRSPRIDGPPTTANPDDDIEDAEFEKVD